MMNNCNTETPISNSRFQWQRQAIAIEHFKATITADFCKANAMVTANLNIEYELQCYFGLLVFYRIYTDCTTYSNSSSIKNNNNNKVRILGG